MGRALSACRPEPEVASAVGRMGLRARSWSLVSTLGAGTQRVCYRVGLDDGRTVKVRRVLDDPQLRRAARLREGLELPCLAPLLDRSGPVWVEAWVEGRTLSETGSTSAHLAAAASVLASLHGVEWFRDERLRGAESTAPWRAVSEERLETLAGIGALARREADALRRSLRRSDPEAAEAGLTHADLAPENLVVDLEGRVVSVDNELLATAPLDLDLMTTWCRWPMPPSHFARFLHAYARRARRRPRDLAFWKLVAATKSAAVRAEHYPDAAPAALARLALLAGEGARASPAAMEGAP